MFPFSIRTIDAEIALRIEAISTASLYLYDIICSTCQRNRLFSDDDVRCANKQMAIEHACKQQKEQEKVTAEYSNPINIGLFSSFCLLFYRSSWWTEWQQFRYLPNFCFSIFEAKEILIINTQRKNFLIESIQTCFSAHPSLSVHVFQLIFQTHTRISYIESVACEVESNSWC